MGFAVHRDYESNRCNPRKNFPDIHATPPFPSSSCSRFVRKLSFVKSRPPIGPHHQFRSTRHGNALRPARCALFAHARYGHTTMAFSTQAPSCSCGEIGEGTRSGSRKFFATLEFSNQIGTTGKSQFRLRVSGAVKFGDPAPILPPTLSVLADRNE